MYIYVCITRIRAQGIWLNCGELEPVIAREQGFLKALKRIVASG